MALVLGQADGATYPTSVQTNSFVVITGATGTTPAANIGGTQLITGDMYSAFSAIGDTTTGTVNLLASSGAGSGDGGTAYAYATGSFTESQNEAYQLGFLDYMTWKDMGVLTDIDDNLQSQGIDFTQPQWGLTKSTGTGGGLPLNSSTPGDGSVQDSLNQYIGDLGGPVGSGYVDSQYFAPMYSGSPWTVGSNPLATYSYGSAPYLYYDMTSISQAQFDIYSTGSGYYDAQFNPDSNFEEFEGASEASVVFPFMSVSVSGTTISGSAASESLTIPLDGATTFSTIFNAVCTMIGVMWTFFRLTKYMRSAQ